MKPQSIQILEDDNRSRARRLGIAFVVLCAIGAAAAARRIVALGSGPLAGSSPFASLDAHFAAKAGMTLLHIVPSLLFVLLVPLQFASTLRQRYPQFHRWNGRAIMGLGVVTGLSALSLSAHPVGGVAEGTATSFFGALFLFSLSRAWLHIRSRRVELHREWGTRMVAIAIGAATTRPIIGVFFATRSLTGLSPEQFFGPAMWLGFTATWVAGEIWIRHTRARAVQSPNFA
ncbi:MAG TPA: DUF2306 domain-containing protein [Bryobacteraceae bacterium]|nr:DUF2306 domain-containing protein [Bryobacteraceae bacterium]